VARNKYIRSDASLTEKDRYKIVKEIKIMNKEKVGNDTKRMIERRESARSKILDKRENRYKSPISSEKIKKLYI